MTSANANAPTDAERVQKLQALRDPSQARPIDEVMADLEAVMSADADKAR